MAAILFWPQCVKPGHLKSLKKTKYIFAFNVTRPLLHSTCSRDYFDGILWYILHSKCWEFGDTRSGGISSHDWATLLRIFRVLYRKWSCFSGVIISFLMCYLPTQEDSVAIRLLTWFTNMVALVPALTSTLIAAPWMNNFIPLHHRGVIFIYFIVLRLVYQISLSKRCPKYYQSSAE